MECQRWCAAREHPHDYAITTAEEVNAVCRALSSNHIYAVDSIKTPALDNLLVFLQSVETPVASSVFRDKGLPLLRRILSDALDGPRVADSEDRVAEESRADAHLFLVKILTMYQQRGDASLIVTAARDPRMPRGDSTVDVPPEDVYGLHCCC
jgi:hypothetical protein